MSYARSSERVATYHGDWLPARASHSPPSAYASPPPENQHLDYKRRDSHSTSDRAPSSYVPPFARTDRYRPSHHHEHDIDYQPSRSPEKHENERHADAPHDNSCSNGDYAKESLDAKRIMPKHFQKPLTCFYWANQGHCTKSVEQCWYAHHWTGVIAAAPVRIGQGNPVAGRVAERAVDEATAREQAIQDRERAIEQREAVITAREKDVANNEEAIEQSAANLKLNIHRVYEELFALGAASQDTCRLLAHYRIEVKKIQDQPADPRRPVHSFNYIADQLLASLDDAIVNLSIMHEHVGGIEGHMKEHVGDCQAEEDGCA